MRSSFPWFLKLVIKLIIANVPFPYSFWRSLGIFRHGRMDNISYALSVFNHHIDKFSNFSSLDSPTILEIGPGDFASTSLLAYSRGAKSILLDGGSYVSKDIKSYKDFACQIFSTTPFYEDISSASSFSELLDLCQSSYLTNGIKSLSLIPKHSVDFAFSQAVLEHIPREQFHDYFSNIFRILKPGSFSSHQIDLKDHLSYGLNNLRFPPSIWESKYFKRADSYTNRLRYSEMINIFDSLGFQVSVLSVSRWDSLPIKQQSLDPHFRNFSQEDLLIKEFDVLLYRP